MNTGEGQDARLAPRHAHPGLSACIITFNEADRIGACLDSLSFCDEVVVVDSHSTDDTRQIAMARGAIVIERDWPGYRSQRQFAAGAASHDWIFSIDADERVTPELRAELEALKSQGFAGIAGASVPTLTSYFGKFLRHGNAWPDRHVRLFDRRRARWGGYEIHEKILLDGDIARLHGPLEHHSYRNFGEHVAKMDRYAQLMADHSFAAGKRTSLLQVLLNPPFRFLRGMLIKRGFMDGWRGLAYHLVEAGYVRRKYLRLWMLGKTTADRSSGQ
jgi:glycosyltransferase involved in cell wall biosynthesis